MAVQVDVPDGHAEMIRSKILGKVDKRHWNENNKDPEGFPLGSTEVDPNDH